MCSSKRIALLALLLLFTAALSAQSTGIIGGGVYFPVSGGGGSPIALDGSNHFFASGGTTTASGTLSSVTAGDAITCEYQNYNDGTSEAISDGTNGAYTFAVSAFGYSGITNDMGIAYFLNSAGGSITVTLTATSGTSGVALSCQAWKNVRTTNALDGNGLFIGSTNAASTNPMAGSSQSPSTNGELVLGFMANDNSTVPTQGSGYTLIDNNTPDAQFNEYSIQTTKTASNCPYTAASAAWIDLCVSFLPSSAAAGTIPILGAVTMEGLSNGVAPTATTMVSSSYLAANNTAAWTVSNPDSVLTGAAGNLCTLGSTLLVNGTSTTGSGSLSLNYATGHSPDAISIQLGGTYARLAEAYCFTTSIPQTDSSSNRYSIGQIYNLTNPGANSCNAQIVPTGPFLTLGLEDSGSLASGSVAISTSTTYQVQILYTLSGCSLAVYNTSGTQVGSTITSGTTHLGATNISLGISGGETESSGHAIQFDTWFWSGQAAFPLPLL
jgi:hypothetical protein